MFCNCYALSTCGVLGMELPAKREQGTQIKNEAIARHAVRDCDDESVN